MFSVSGRISTKTGTPPLSTTALAVDTNVKEGMITSAPGSIPVENGRHFQRRSAGMSEQNRTRADEIGKPAFAAFGEFAVARKLPLGQGFVDVLDFIAGERRPIKGYLHGEGCSEGRTVWRAAPYTE